MLLALWSDKHICLGEGTIRKESTFVVVLENTSCEHDPSNTTARGTPFPPLCNRTIVGHKIPREADTHNNLRRSRFRARLCRGRRPSFAVQPCNGNVVRLSSVGASKSPPTKARSLRTSVCSLRTKTPLSIHGWDGDVRLSNRVASIERHILENLRKTSSRSLLKFHCLQISLKIIGICCRKRTEIFTKCCVLDFHCLPCF